MPSLQPISSLFLVPGLVSAPQRPYPLTLALRVCSFETPGLCITINQGLIGEVSDIVDTGTAKRLVDFKK